MAWTEPRDEQVALAATAAPWWHDPGKVWLDQDAFEAYDRRKGHEFVGYGESPFSGCIAATGPGSHAQSMADAQHIARWDPVRVLAEVQAKRQVLDAGVPRRDREETGEYLRFGNWTSCADDCASTVWWEILKLMAQPYVGQPGWQEEWGA